MHKKLGRYSKMAGISCRVLCGAAIVLALGTGAANASYINPFTSTPTLQLSKTEEQAYLDQRTQAMFSQAGKPLKEESYIAPKGWQKDLQSFRSVHLEKYTSSHKKNDKVILQIHGGGYIQGNHNSHRDWAIARAEAMGSGEVYMLNYRYYPEAKYPAALEEAAAAYQELLKSGIPAKNMVVMGDSAGGNLALALALYLRDHNIAEPGSLVLYSPWGDAGDLPTREINQNRDVILGVRNHKMNDAVVNNDAYFQDADLKDPYVSPVYADFKGLPPILIIAGGQELFVDDCRLLEQRSLEAGVPVEVHLYPGMSHDWPLLFPELSESKDTYRVLEEFENKY